MAIAFVGTRSRIYSPISIGKRDSCRLRLNTSLVFLMNGSALEGKVLGEKRRMKRGEGEEEKGPGWVGIWRRNLSL